MPYRHSEHAAGFRNEGDFAEVCAECWEKFLGELLVSYVSIGSGLVRSVYYVHGHGHGYVGSDSDGDIESDIYGMQ